MQHPLSSQHRGLSIKFKIQHCGLEMAVMSKVGRVNCSQGGMTSSIQPDDTRHRDEATAGWRHTRQHGGWGCPARSQTASWGSWVGSQANSCESWGGESDRLTAVWRASPPSQSQEEGAEKEEEGLDSGNQVSLLGDLLHVKGAEQHQQYEELQQGSHGAHVSLGDRVATPLHWLHCAWFTPFTSYPLASKLARLGLEEDELEGKGLEIREEQERGQAWAWAGWLPRGQECWGWEWAWQSCRWKRRGWGRHLLSSLVWGDEDGGGRTVGQYGPAPTPHQHNQGCAKPGHQGPGGQKQVEAGFSAGGGPTSQPRDTCTPHKEAHWQGAAGEAGGGCESAGQGSGGPGGPPQHLSCDRATPSPVTAGVMLQQPSNTRLLQKLQIFHGAPQGWGEAVRSLVLSKPQQISRELREEEVMRLGNKRAKRPESFMDQGWVLLEDSPLIGWSMLEEKLEVLAKVRADLKPWNEMLLGLLVWNLDPQAVLRQLSLAGQLHEQAAKEYESLSKQLLQRVRQVCPWPLQPEESGGKRASRGSRPPPSNQPSFVWWTVATLGVATWGQEQEPQGLLSLCLSIVFPSLLLNRNLCVNSIWPKKGGLKVYVIKSHS